MASDMHREYILDLGRASARSIQSRLSRRQALRLGGFALGGLAIGALAACSPSSGPPASTAPATAAPAAGGAPAAAGGTFDWQRYKGQTITALQVQNSRTDIMVKYQ